MKTADSLRKLIHNSIVETSVQTDQRILKDALERLEKVRQDRLAGGRPNVGRLIMKSPITKLATAAIVAIACLIGLSLWRGTESGIALADVLAQIEKVKAYKCQMYIKITSEDPNKPYSFEMRETTLNSQEYGSKRNDVELDPNSGESTFTEGYFLPQKNTSIAIVHKDKIYCRTELDDGQVEQIRKLDNARSDPRTVVNNFLQGKYESLGRSTINGIEVEGFQIIHPGSGVSVEKMWVDVKTRLPVRYEYESFNNNQVGGFNYKLHVRIVIENYQWDVTVDASEFEPPPIPDGYTVTVIKLPPNNEETAIQGLKQCVEFFGKYPERILDIWRRVYRLVSGASDDTLQAERLKEEIKGLTKDELINKLLMPIRGLERFANGLEWDNKDPAYYGKTVTPKDADKVLMRWKVSDNEYRVIYGDLHAETVTPERLAELEAALPK